MSSTSYTHIQNTIVSGLTIVDALSGADVNAINFAGAMDRSGIITLASAAVELTPANWVQAAVGVQLVNGAAAGAGNLLDLGTDSATQAAYYISLFDLASGIGQKVLLNFQIDNAAIGATDVSIGTAATGGSHVSIDVFLNGGAVNSAQVIFGNTEAAGHRAVVECYATNVTSGSEVVAFNVCPNP